MQEFEFQYRSYFLQEYLELDQPPLISVLVEYDTFTSPRYDSPLGGLGTETFTTSEHVTAIFDSEGNSLLALRDSNIKFLAEINEQMLKRQDVMIDRLRDYP
jgi:hypothetical protein